MILPDGKRGQIPELADSKLLTAKARDRCYDQIRARALAWSVVSIEADECDRLGMHVANVQALRRALFRLDVRPSYVLTDGFGVDGLGVPGLAIWKGDRVAACIAAASVIAKVTRDRIMQHWDSVYPRVRFRGPQGVLHARAPGGTGQIRPVSTTSTPIRECPPQSAARYGTECDQSHRSGEPMSERSERTKSRAAWRSRGTERQRGEGER